jgi:hypothetical protein
MAADAFASPQSAEPFERRRLEPHAIALDRKARGDHPTHRVGSRSQFSDARPASSGRVHDAESRVSDVPRQTSAEGDAVGAIEARIVGRK